MGSKRKDKHREKRSRSRSRPKIKKERHRSRSISSHCHRKKRRERSTSSNESFASLKHLAAAQASTNYTSHVDIQPLQEYDQEYFFRMSKRIQEDFKEEFDKGKQIMCVRFIIVVN